MPTYTVIDVSPQARDWASTQGGPMKAYRVTMKDENGVETPNVEWSRKIASPAPQVGDSLAGTIDTSGQFGPKFKAQPAGGGFGGKGRSPEENARIIRQHSQSVAVASFVAQGKSDFTIDELRQRIDWFDRDAKAAKP